MNKGIIFLVILILVLCGLFGWVYFKYEKVKQNENPNLNLVNLSIQALDIDNKNLVVPIQINVDGFYYSNLTTLKNDYIFTSVPLNSSIDIFNIDNNSYYLYKESFFSNIPEIKRINLKLVSPSLINFTHKIDQENKIINLTIISPREYRDSSLCFNWGLHIIDLKVNYTLITKENYDKCYFIGNLNNENRSINIDYKMWGELNSDDFINISLIDSINTTNSYLTKY